MILWSFYFPVKLFIITIGGTINIAHINILVMVAITKDMMHVYMVQVQLKHIVVIHMVMVCRKNMLEVYMKKIIAEVHRKGIVKFIGDAIQVHMVEFYIVEVYRKDTEGTGGGHSGDSSYGRYSGGSGDGYSGDVCDGYLYTIGDGSRTGAYTGDGLYEGYSEDDGQGYSEGSYTGYRTGYGEGYVGRSKVSYKELYDKRCGGDQKLMMENELMEK